MTMRFSHGAKGCVSSKRWSAGEGLDERLLTDVVREPAVGGDRVRGAPREDPVAVEERARGLRRPVSGEDDEFGVGAACTLAF